MILSGQYGDGIDGTRLNEGASQAKLNACKTTVTSLFTCTTSEWILQVSYPISRDFVPFRVDYPFVIPNLIPQNSNHDPALLKGGTHI